MSETVPATFDRPTFFSYAGAAAIWVGGLGLTFQLHLVVVLPVLLYLVAASAVVAVPGGRIGNVMFGVWAVAAVLVVLAVRTTTQSWAPAVYGTLIGVSLLVGAWSLTGAMLLHAKTGGPRV